MYKIDLVSEVSQDKNYNVINCKTKQIAGFLKRSIDGDWFYTNKELGIINKKFDTIALAVLAVIN